MPLLPKTTRRTKNDFYYVQKGNIYDENIAKVIPYYYKMHEIIIECIPFDSKKHLEVLDLGVGTGANTYHILKKFPNAFVTGIDLFGEMLQKARKNLQKYQDRFRLIRGDITKIKFSKKFNIIVSALTIHHLSNQDKRKLYQKIYNRLANDGIFINGDLTDFQSEYLSQLAQKISDDFMKKNVKDKTVIKGWYRHWHEKNILAPLESQLNWLRDCGFKDVDVVFRYYQTAVFCGRR